LLMDTMQIGIAQTYLYELMDEGDGWGLFDTSNNPKPAATAIHNLTTILGDAATSTAAATFTVNGMPTSGNSLALLKTSGVTDIIVWAEPQISGTTAGPLTNVTIVLGANASSATIYDPMVGTTPTQTLNNVTNVPIGLTDHPIIVEVASGGTGKTSPPVPLTGTVSPQTWATYDQNFAGVTLTSGKPFH